MPDLYIIMGDRNVRKSSTIRALTGAYNKGVYKIAIKSGQVIDVFVQISSLQESKISPEDFIKEVNSEKYKHVLLSLWISPGNEQKSGLDYINEFIKEKEWSIKEIVVLGMNESEKNNLGLPTNVPTPNFIQNSGSLPANQIASQIRNWWCWL